MSEITHIVRAVVNPFRDHGEYATTWCGEKILWTKPSRSIDQALSVIGNEVAAAYPTCLHCLAAAHAAIGEHLEWHPPEPVYASLEVTTPPRIVEYRTVIRSSREALDADINVLLPEWQPYRDQQSQGALAWQVMVRYGEVRG